jgi:hypothetical protein
MGFLKKITRPISRALDKIIPNEVKPALPFLAAAAPFMAPGLMGLGGNTMLSRALMSGGLNIGAQLAQEGSEGEFSGLSALMAAGTGALSAPGTPGTGVGPAGQYGTTGGTPSAADYFSGKAAGMDPGFAKSGLGALEKSSNYLTGVGDTLQNNLFSMEGLKAAAIPVGQGTTDLAVAENRRAMRDYERELADYEASIGDSSDMGNRALAIRQSMEAYGFPEDEILAAIEAAGYANGGRVGYAFGDLVRGSSMVQPVPNSSGGPMPSSGMGGMLSNLINSNPQIFSNITNQENNSVSNMSRDFIDLNQNGIDDRQEKAYGGRVGLANGGDLKEAALNNILYKFGGKYDRPTSSGDSLEDKITEKQLGDVLKYDFQGPAGVMGLEESLDMITPESVSRSAMKMQRDGDPDFGGIPAAVESVEEKPKEFLVDKLKVTVQPGQSEQMAIMNAMMNDIDEVMPEDRKMEFYKLYLPQLRESGEISEKEYQGLMGELFGEGKAEGGLMNLGGREMDMRTGGFIPIGKKERADDVPARLSKNEFVMTADAVRAAGGGSVNEGARRMYNLMNNLEAKV